MLLVVDYYLIVSRGSIPRQEYNTVRLSTFSYAQPLHNSNEKRTI
jgi:hypothetical protein